MYKEILGKPLAPGDIIFYNNYVGHFETGIITELITAQDDIPTRVRNGWVTRSIKVFKLYDKSLFDVNGRFVGDEPSVRRATLFHKIVIKVDRDEFFQSTESDATKALVNNTIQRILNGQGI